MSKLPLIAIVGRANVGKSSVFNRLVGWRQAIVAQEPGTTRDAVAGRLATDKGEYLLVDTAGLKTAEDSFEAGIQDQISEAAGVADLLLVVIDAQTMLVEEDRRVAKLAHKTKVPVILVVNKSESGRVDEAEIKRLGIRTYVLTSASQNRGFGELIKTIGRFVKPVKITDSQKLKISLVGRPNVGKSSLFNALANAPKAVVDDVAGTTRDVNRLELDYEDRQLEIMDTAGIRRSGKIVPGIERFSVLRAMSAIEESDVSILVLDATEPAVTLDQKLAGAIKDAGKGLILALNKWDLVDKDAFTLDKLTPKIRSQFQHVPWAMLSVTSAHDKQNVNRLLQLALKIDSNRRIKMPTPGLNRWLGEQVNHHPPAGLRNTQPKLKYVTQTGQRPPEITIFGRDVRVVHWSYKRYLERELRQQYELDGTPVIIKFSDKDPRK